MSENYSFDDDFSYDENEDRYQLWLEQHEDCWDDSDDEFEDPQEFDIELYAEYCQSFIMNLLK